MHASNMVWVDPPGLPASVDGPKLAYLWGSQQGDQPSGTFVKFPAGFAGEIHSDNSTFRAVVIQGQLQYLGASVETLDPGSYFSSEGEGVHQISSTAREDIIIYVRSSGQYKIVSRRE